MRLRKIYDISVTIRPDMPIWPGNPEFKRTLYRAMKEGASSDVSIITMGSHTGTHVDAPAHFIPGGSTVDEIPLDILVGEVVVYTLSTKKQISKADLEPLELTGRTRVLFKTRNSSLWKSDRFTPDFVSFEPEAAIYLVDKGVKLVGIDYLSVGKFHAGAQAHQIFLENGVAVIEGLDLSKIESGSYELICLPLKIQGADAAPARALLREP